LSYKYFVHFSGRRLFAFDMEKCVLVLAFLTPSDTLCSYAEMHKIFIAQKSHCSLCRPRCHITYVYTWTEIITYVLRATTTYVKLHARRL